MQSEPRIRSLSHLFVQKFPTFFFPHFCSFFVFVFFAIPLLSCNFSFLLDLPSNIIVFITISQDSDVGVLLFRMSFTWTFYVIASICCCCCNRLYFGFHFYVYFLCFTFSFFFFFSLNV